MKNNPPCKALGASSRQMSRRGFSLIELLAVMAIIGMMTAAVIPAMSSLKKGGDVNRTVYDIAGVLEQARAHAMANNTYVFVGFTEVDATTPESAAGQTPGTGRVVVVAAGSKDGTRTFGTGNSNLIPLGKARNFANIHLESSTPNTGNLTRPSVAGGYQVAAPGFVAENSFSWPLSGQAKYTFTKIIQFDSRGTATIQSTSGSMPQWIEVGLAPAQGTTVAPTANYAALQLDGVTGSVKIYRP